MDRFSFMQMSGIYVMHLSSISLSLILRRFHTRAQRHLVLAYFYISDVKVFILVWLAAKRERLMTERFKERKKDEKKPFRAIRRILLFE